MVVGERKSGGFEIVCDHEANHTFSDQKSADISADQMAKGYENVFVLEAVSRYTIPEPRVVKQNLHIPPLTPRGESNE
jgi:hypothetical protein